MTSRSEWPTWWCRCLQLWFIVRSLPASDVAHAAHSISVLDSKLAPLYQTYPQFGYDFYEPGFAADPAGYAARNAFHPHHSRTDTAKESSKAGPGEYPVEDGGYHTKTVPFFEDHRAGYATQNANAFQPRHSGGKNDGYHTRTVGFPMYQSYQHPYYAEPAVGYATRTAFHPYRSAGPHHTKDVSRGGDYQTKTAESEWIPLYQDYQHHRHDPGGYATQNAFQPYRSAAEVDGTSKDSNRVDHGRTAADSQYFDDSQQSQDEGLVVYRQFFSDDVDEEQHRTDDRQLYVNDDDDDDVVTGEWSTQRPTPIPSASAIHYYSTDNFLHTPTIVSTGGWRSAVGQSPQIHLTVPATSVSSTNQRAPRYSKFDITIDRFGQEEDVTGASFAEPIGEIGADRTGARSSGQQLSRSVSKQSDYAVAAQLSNPLSKFDRQPTTVHKLSHHRLDPCTSLPDGDYPLDERFHSRLPHVNSRCNFVKCAHKSAFVNPCSIGTRNPDQHDASVDPSDRLTTGAHYCSVRDVDSYCEHLYYHHPRDDDDNDVKHYYLVSTRRSR